MRNEPRFWIAAALFCLVISPVVARAADTDHLKVDLISDAASVTPGKPLWVGFHFVPEKEWHIYWVNPGDSGEPPRVTWHLPDGFQAGSIEWPAPERLGAGTVIDYGYSGPVVLPVEVRVPANVKPGSTIAISATLRWLVCHDICVPGKADLTLSLPVQTSPAPQSSSHELFKEALARVPKPAPAAWKVEAVSENDDFVLTVHAGARIQNATFFPLDAEQIENSAPQNVSAIPGGVRLTLKKSDQLLKTPATLRGVIELADGKAYEVSAPVSAPRRGGL
jgi:DsbC/DsbD-like thiol-disulfide interchange protein